MPPLASANVQEVDQTGLAAGLRQHVEAARSCAAAGRAASTRRFPNARGRGPRVLALAAILAGTVAGVAHAGTWGWEGGIDWGVAFPEREQFGSFGPEYAAAIAANNVGSPKDLMERWQRLPNDLRQWDCGTDGLGQPRRCLDMTYRGSNDYAGKAVRAHFDTINGIWHFMAFNIVKD